MTYEETLAIMSVLKAAYPSYYRDMKKADAESVVSLWAEMFADEPVQMVAMAVKSLIAADNKGFPPHIGAVKAHIVKIKNPDEMTEQEAWNYVERACRNSLYNSAEEYAKLPPVVQRLIGSHNQLREWAMIDADELKTVVASNFMRSYRVRTANERENLALPADVRNTIQALADGIKMPALTERDS